MALPTTSTWTIFDFDASNISTILGYTESITVGGAGDVTTPGAYLRLLSDDSAESSLDMDVSVGKNFSLEMNIYGDDLPPDLTALASKRVFISVYDQQDNAVGLLLSQSGLAAVTAVTGVPSVNPIPGSASLISEDVWYTLRLVVDGESDTLYIYFTPTASLSTTGHILRYIFNADTAPLGATDTCKIEVFGTAGDNTDIHVDVFRLSTLLNIPNKPPIADPGEDRSVLTGEYVKLDGTGSYDPEGADLSYSWRLLSAPEDSLYLSVGYNGTTPSEGDPDNVTNKFEHAVGFSSIDLLTAGDLLIVGDVVAEIDSSTFNEDGTLVNPQQLVLTTPALTENETGLSWSIAHQECIGDATSGLTYAHIDAVGLYGFGLTVNDGEIDGLEAEVLIQSLDTHLIPSTVPDVSYLWKCLGDEWDFVSDSNKIEDIWSAFSLVAAGYLYWAWQVHACKSLSTIPKNLVRKWVGIPTRILPDKWDEETFTDFHPPIMTTVGSTGANIDGETLIINIGGGQYEITFSGTNPLPIASIVEQINAELPSQVATKVNGYLAFQGEEYWEILNAGTANPYFGLSTIDNTKCYLRGSNLTPRQYPGRTTLKLFITKINSLAGIYTAHIADVAAHALADGDNTLDVLSLANTASVSDIYDFLNDIKAKYNKHDGNNPGAYHGAWGGHTVTIPNATDWYSAIDLYNSLVGILGLHIEDVSGGYHTAYISYTFPDKEDEWTPGTEEFRVLTINDPVYLSNVDLCDMLLLADDSVYKIDGVVSYNQIRIRTPLPRDDTYDWSIKPIAQLKGMDFTLVRFCSADKLLVSFTPDDEDEETVDVNVGSDGGLGEYVTWDPTPWAYYSGQNVIEELIKNQHLPLYNETVSIPYLRDGIEGATTYYEGKDYLVEEIDNEKWLNFLNVTILRTAVINGYNKFAEKYTSHIGNTPATGGAYHPVADTGNILQYESLSTDASLTTVCAAFIDLKAKYNSHDADPAPLYHGAVGGSYQESTADPTTWAGIISIHAALKSTFNAHIISAGGGFHTNPDYDNEVTETLTLVGQTDVVNAPEKWWAEYYVIENSAIEDNFGYLVGIEPEDIDTDYLSAVRALFYSYWNGAKLESLRLGIHTLFGLPMAEAPGTIIDINPIYTESLGRILIEDSDSSRIRSYLYDRNAEVADNPSTDSPYTVGDEVDIFARLCTGVDITDYISDADWLQKYITQGVMEEVEKYHTFYVEADIDIFGLNNIFMAQSFLDRAKAARTDYIFVSYKGLVDEIDVEDLFEADANIHLYENVKSFSDGGSRMMDDENGSGIIRGDMGEYRTTMDFFGMDSILPLGTRQHVWEFTDPGANKGNLIDDFMDVFSNMTSHMSNVPGAYHSTTDTFNQPIASMQPTGFDTFPELVEKARYLIDKYNYHDNNEGGAYHTTPGTHLFISAIPYDFGSLCTFFNEFKAVYNAHLADAAIHAAADGDHDITTADRFIGHRMNPTGEPPFIAGKDWSGYGPGSTITELTGTTLELRVTDGRICPNLLAVIKGNGVTHEVDYTRDSTLPILPVVDFSAHETAQQWAGDGCFLFNNVAAPSFVQYQDASFISGASEKGTICFRMLPHPDYIPAPAPLCYFMQAHGAAGLSNNIEIYASITAGPNFDTLNADIYDAAGALISAVSGPFTPSPHTWHEFAFTWDVVNGYQELMVDGVPVAPPAAGVGLRTANLNTIYFGFSTVAGPIGDFLLDNFRIYDGVIHNAGYTPPFTEEYCDPGTTTITFGMVTKYDVIDTINDQLKNVAHLVEYPSGRQEPTLLSWNRYIEIVGGTSLDVFGFIAGQSCGAIEKYSLYGADTAGGLNVTGLTFKFSIGDHIVNRLNDLGAEYTNHISNTGGAYHSTADSTNVLTLPQLTFSSTTSDIYDYINDFKAQFNGHDNNNGGSYHSAAGTHQISSPSATTWPSFFTLFNEIISSVYDHHLDDGTVHSAADDNNRFHQSFVTYEVTFTGPDPVTGASIVSQINAVAPHTVARLDGTTLKLGSPFLLMVEPDGTANSVLGFEDIIRATRVDSRADVRPEVWVDIERCEDYGSGDSKNDVVDALNDLGSFYTNHISNNPGAYHPVVDATNTLATLTLNYTDTMTDCVNYLNDVKVKLNAHDNNNGGGYHGIVGTHQVAAADATDWSSLVTLYAAIVVVFNAHIADS